MFYIIVKLCCPDLAMYSTVEYCYGNLSHKFNCLISMASKLEKLKLRDCIFFSLSNFLLSNLHS